jgi:hypothetical protein
MIDYIKITVITVICASFFGGGWWVGYSKYLDYKKEVEIIAKTQEEKVKSIRSQQELVNKSTEKEYEAKIAAIRNYYKSTSVWNNPSSGKVSGISATPSISDVSAAYSTLTGQCAQTTQQLVSLQDWINEQIGIK